MVLYVKGGIGWVIQAGVAPRFSGKGCNIAGNRGVVQVVSLYNPGGTLDGLALRCLMSGGSSSVLWMRDFNVHSELWGLAVLVRIAGCLRICWMSTGCGIE
uniref:Uncharacterized protein n=2 Tax=Nothobranchius furzeri TaxID=105023 RepID=A0A1A8AJC6_NOTFU